MNDALRRLLFRTPLIGKKLGAWYADAETLHRLGPGHFYSPIASDEDVNRYASFDVGEKRSITVDKVNLPAIDLCLDDQAALADRWLGEDALNLSWASNYDPANEYFQSLDAMVLAAVIRDSRPERIIEIGSGHSTTAMLDALSEFDLPETEVTLIEPYPRRLLDALPESERQRFELRERPLSRDDAHVIGDLTAGDILLVDSSHVYKIGSDVKLLFDEIFPSLASGVVVHIHDIFFPFEYPASWLRRGHHYNEAYVLRTFLQHNSDFQILFWNDLMRWLIGTRLGDKQHLPSDQVASSLWLRRV